MYLRAAAAQDGCLHTAREVNDFLERGSGRTNFVLSTLLINDPTEPAVFVQDKTGRTIIANQKEMSGFRHHSTDITKNAAVPLIGTRNSASPSAVSVIGSTPAAAPHSETGVRSDAEVLSV